MVDPTHGAPRIKRRHYLLLTIEMSNNHSVRLINERNWGLGMANITLFAKVTSLALSF